MAWVPHYQLQSVLKRRKAVAKKMAISAKLVDRAPEEVARRQAQFVDALFQGASLKRAWKFAYQSNHYPSLDSVLYSSAIRRLCAEHLAAGGQMRQGMHERVVRACTSPADTFERFDI